MRYLLDTNICIYLAKRNHPKVVDRFNRLQPGDVRMSVVTYGELYFGTQKSSHQAAAIRRLSILREVIPVLPLEPEVAEQYGRLRSNLQRRGRPIGPNDTWIAAHCLQLGLILVTNNEGEFNRVPDLIIENWTR